MERVKRQQQELEEMRMKYTIHHEEKIVRKEQENIQVSFKVPKKVYIEIIYL